MGKPFSPQPRRHHAAECGRPFGWWFANRRLFFFSGAVLSLLRRSLVRGPGPSSIPLFVLGISGCCTDAINGPVPWQDSVHTSQGHQPGPPARAHRDQPSGMSSVTSFTTALCHAIISGGGHLCFYRPECSRLSPLTSHLSFSSIMSSPTPDSRAVRAMVRHSAAELQNWLHRCKGWL